MLGQSEGRDFKAGPAEKESGVPNVAMESIASGDTISIVDEMWDTVNRIRKSTNVSEEHVTSIFTVEE
jgi:hypothetical protein